MRAHGTPDTPTDPLADSVARGLAEWMAELPGVDPAIEAVRQRIAGLGRLLERGLGRIAPTHGVSLGDWEALAVLQRSGPPYEGTPNEIAHAIGVTSGTMSVRIERLAHAGLIERAPSRTDRRSRPIRLTKKGQEHWSAATADRTDAEQNLIGNALDPSELEQLNVLLAKLLRRFEDELGIAPVRGPLNADER